jgi:hypothetical protein
MHYMHTLLKKIIQRQIVTMDVINLDAKALFFDPNYCNSCIRKMLKCDNNAEV